MSADQVVDPAEAPRGYALALPPGWRRIPVEGAAPVVRALLDESFAGLPSDRHGPYRHELERIVFEQVDAARRNMGVDLYLPWGGARGLPVAASFVVSHLPPDHAPPEQVLAALGGGGDQEPVTIDGAPGLRARRTVAAQPARQHGLDVDTDRVTYVLSVPRAGGWLLLSFSTALTGAAVDVGRDDTLTLAQVMVELFDAVVSTLRWRPA